MPVLLCLVSAASILLAPGTSRAAPGSVTNLTATATGTNEITLSWTPYSGNDFARYEIRRGTAAGVTTTSPLVDTLSAKTASSFADRTVLPYTTYYYKVFVIDTAGVAGSSAEPSARTLALSYPFADTVAATNVNFVPTGTWAIVANSPGEGDAYSGSWHWSDSPGGNYAPNSNGTLTLAIRLGTATMPVLTYRERYAFETNVDYGHVEVSADGTNWYAVASVTGSQTTWAERRIDLTQWAGYDGIRIRFRIAASSSVESDGWHLDSFTINETPLASMPYPLREDFESGTSRWLLGGWSPATEGTNGPTSIHDSKTGNYPALAYNVMISTGVFDLTFARNPTLVFWHRYNIFNDHSYGHNEDDWGRVYVSSDYGRPGSWVNIASYNGSQPTWTRVQLDLSQFAGSPSVRVMFLLDDNVDAANASFNRQADGWYLDDIRLEDLPRAVEINPIVSSSMHHVDLTWSPNTEGDFARYEIYRATSTAVTRSSTLVSTITNAAVSSWTDSVAMIEPTQYSYRIYVVDTLETLSLGSNVVTATYTVPLIAFPFADSMNASTQNWAFGYPWGSTTETYHSAPTCWTDSPGKAYAANANTALATRINLSGSVDPVLTFWHKHDLETNADYGVVEISTDAGQTWTEVFRVTGVDTAWAQERVDLGKYVGSTLGLRFRLMANASTQLGGWYIDDVAVENGSRMVGYPWADDFEGGHGAWFAQSPWGLSSENSRSGMWHWTDSPAGVYRSGENTALRITIDLSQATAPQLSFWQRYSFEPNADWGFVEVSTNDGASWTQVCFVTGSSAEWVSETIDLSPFRGNPRVQVRFRLTSNGSQESDGWHIDDVAFSEVAQAIPYPFVERFDNGDTDSRWLTASWEPMTGGMSAPYLMHDSRSGNYPADAFSALTLAGTIDLRNATYPVMTFWHKYAFFTDHSYGHNEDDYGRVYVSPDNGAVWYLMASYTGSVSDWTKTTINLSQFVGASSVRVRFVIDDNIDAGNTSYNRQSDGWWLDEIRVEELPAPVTLNPITSSSQHHAALSWTRNADTDFSRYEIRRATSSAVTTSSDLVKTITTQSTTAWTDTFALVEPTRFSYRVYVVDTLESVSPGSNILTADYTIPLKTFPFTDDMSAATENWSWGDPWGPTSESFHSGPASWKSGPGRAYPPNANTALATRVNLSGSTAPVLTFWHRYAFEQAVDFGYVEISSDGGQTWTAVMAVTGVDTMWASERIDLGAYMGSTIGLRFRVTSNATTHLDGWYIDDVAIANGPRMASYPLFDDMESGPNAWFPQSPWGLSNVGSRSGEWHWTDSPAGSYAPNTNSALTLRINLSGAAAPELRFWQRYSFEPNADWGYVEVSGNNGSSWTQACFVTGSQASWREERVDLSPWKGNADVLLRFRLTSNASNESDGWHIDDISMVEVAREFPYPFVETFDDTAVFSRWHTASWEPITGGRTTPFQMHDSPLGNYPANAFSGLTLAGTIDLRGATNPVLTFWQKASLFQDQSYGHNEYDYGRVYISPDNGAVWYLVNSTYGSVASWTKVSISLTQFVGASAVRVRFVMDDDVDGANAAYNRQADGWWIDDVRIGENLAVQALADSVRLEGPALAFAVPGLASPRYIGRIYEPSVTSTAGQGANVVGQFGVGPRGTTPNDTSWTWFNAGYLDDVSGFDRFYGSVRVDSSGEFDVAFRGSIDGGVTWVYADLDGNNLAGGGVNEYTTAQAARLIIGRGASVRLDVATVERGIRTGTQEFWPFSFSNGGPDALAWWLAEADTNQSVKDIPWLVIGRSSGTLAEGGRAVVDLTFSAVGLNPGLYKANLMMVSNDALNDTIAIPVRLTVYATGVTVFTGRVAWTGGGNVAGGTIVASQSNLPVDTIAVSENGQFAAYGIPAGQYDLAVQVPGAYPRAFRNFTLPAENAVLTVTPIHPRMVSTSFADFYSPASTLDGQPLPVGSVVSVRNAAGTVCGSCVATEPGKYGLMHVYADDPSTPETEGASIGDTLAFFVNDVPTGAKAVYAAHFSVTRVDIMGTSATSRRLERGLHLISLAASPNDTTLAGALASIAGKYSYVAGFDSRWGGARTYVDSLADYSDLTSLDGVHGYWIRMEEAGDLAPAATRVHDDTPISLNVGWNLIGYLPVTARAPADALATVLDRVRVVGGFENGAKTFVPGSPFSDLTVLRHAYGYWVSMSAPATLVWRPGAAIAQPPQAKPALMAEGPVPTREWADFYGTLTVDGVPVPAGTEVLLRDPDGVICARTVTRVAGRYGFLHAYGDDPATDPDEGARPGDALRVIVDGREYPGKMAVWTGSLSVTRVDLALSSAATAVSEARPARFAFDGPQPNPFNPSVLLRFELATRGHTRMEVFDGLGRHVRTVISADLGPGRHEAMWDGVDENGRAVASGLYVIRLTAPDGVITRRAVLAR